LKLFIRQRKNSLFYQSEHSAYIASVLTSLIATCLYAGVNALEYLVALKENRRKVSLDPAARASSGALPWAYATSRTLTLGHASPVLGHLGAAGCPFQIKIMSSRADRDTRASALLGHHEELPFESRFIHIQ
jgi:hypothetical protein